MSQSGDGSDQQLPEVLSGWVTRAKLAKDLGLSVSTLARWGGMRIGPAFIRLGYRTYYRIATVQEWLATQENWRRG